MEKPAYQQRVIDEKLELDDKRAKLQCTVMRMYSDILAARIAAF